MITGSPNESIERRRHSPQENTPSARQPCFLAHHATIAIWLRPSRMPGISPARNSAPSEVPVTAE
jgi:hypothetical protein